MCVCGGGGGGISHTVMNFIFLLDAYLLVYLLKTGMSICMWYV